MSQQINDNFQLLAGIPIDDRNAKPTISARDSISSTRRFQGLLCFVEQTQTLYQLQGGILNSNWVGIAGNDISNGLETVIEGFYVLSAGKETLLDWEIGDKFRGWIANRYVVGTILSLPVSLPSDIDNLTRVELVIDSDSISASNFPKGIEYTAVGGETDFEIDTSATATMMFYNGVPQSGLMWDQSGTTINLNFDNPLNAGDFMQFS